MKRTARAFLVLVGLLCLAAAVLWKVTRPGSEVALPKFSVGERRIVPKTAPSFGVGKDFAVMVAPEGTLWGWGDVTGNGAPGAQVRFGPAPKKLSEETDWKQVAAGWFGFLVLKQDGSLWAMGGNNEGLLGIDGVTNSVPKLTRVGTESDWKEIKTGLSHCIALKKDGSLWAWGQNSYGQVGVGFLSRSESITRVGLDTNWVAIAAGAFQGFALRRDGTAWTWGLGFVTSMNNVLPVQIGTETNWASISAGDYHAVGTDSAGENWIVGPNAASMDRAALPGPTTNWVRMSELTNCVEVYSGQDCVLGRERDGGWTETGFLGAWPLQFPKNFEPLAVHLQGQTALFLMPDGRLWIIGRKLPGTPRLTTLEKIWNGLVRFLNRNRNAIGASDEVYKEPFLIWEQ